LIGMVFCLLSPFVILPAIIAIMLFHLSTLDDAIKHLERQRQTISDGDKRISNLYP
jgi:hypothetical protein